jgi:hypothetical protein
MVWHLADWHDSVWANIFLLRMRERVDLSSAKKVNFIVKQNECGVFFFIMHLLQLAFHKIIVATQYMSTGLKPQKSYMFASVAIIFCFMLMMQTHWLETHV